MLAVGALMHRSETPTSTEGLHTEDVSGCSERFRRVTINTVASSTNGAAVGKSKIQNPFKNQETGVILALE
jgi:hypothetical protein